MSHDKLPVTAAIRVLREYNATYTDHLYAYEEHGGTRVSSQALGVEEHAVIKTLIMQDEHKHPLIILMHGDREVSTKNLARHLGAKTITACPPEVANRHSGYLVGGTSPFGTRKAMPVYLEASILQLPKIYLNGGKRGYLIGINPKELQRILQPTLVEVGI